MKTTRRHVDGQEWDLLESGPADASTTVLLLPGGMCTAAAFADVITALEGAPLRVVSATLPGFGRTPHPDDLSMENYAALAGRLAADLGADAVAGHSLGANVAIEMAAAGTFTGPVLLLSPSFCSDDEAKELRFLDRIGRVPGIGFLVWRLALTGLPHSVPKSIPADRRPAFVRALANNAVGFCRPLVRRYYEYLDAHGSLVSRLCDSGVRAVVVFGDHDEVGLTDAEAAALDACPQVTRTTMEDATHFLIAERPGAVADLIVDLVRAPVRG
jgi:pimeloyl-ACP methyl ester carboxylesterase